MPTDTQVVAAVLSLAAMRAFVWVCTTAKRAVARAQREAPPPARTMREGFHARLAAQEERLAADAERARAEEARQLLAKAVVDEIERRRGYR